MTTSVNDTLHQNNDFITNINGDFYKDPYTIFNRFFLII